ncbi:MAG: hypothetical protein EB059_00125 [Alphaproteobacteria bacterium]|nr:hypothetical protein [Alphaproteobacteria bacterium]
MRYGSWFMIALLLCCTAMAPAHAESTVTAPTIPTTLPPAVPTTPITAPTTPTGTDPTLPAPTVSTITTPTGAIITQSNCALDEFATKVNDLTVCKKMPLCATNETRTYDAMTQSFVCIKRVVCDPKKREQPAFINGKHVCLVTPNCDAQGRSYAFDGTKMYCQ